MLSLGKLSEGRAGYYTAQLPGGADEYYTKTAAEAPAVWLGSAAQRLGLEGPVDPDAFRHLLGADHPLTGEPLGVPRTTNHRVPGFDLCFSAPKSVSVAWALASPEVVERIAACHDRAVVSAVEAVESEVARARRGRRAATVVTTEGIVAAAFGHRSSRAGDPQIHTHVVVPNLTVTGDGRWSALAGDRLYRWGKTVGYLYQSALRAELTRTLGVEWGPVNKGAAEITAIPGQLLPVFSTRRAEVTAALEHSGGRSRRARELAALTTRRAKDHHLDLSQLRAGWHAQARDQGIDPEALTGRLDRPGRPVADRCSAVTPGLLSADGLCANSSTFDRRDLLQALASAHPDGLPASDVTTGADRFLGRPEIVTLAAARNDQRYTTLDQLRVETELMAAAGRRIDAGVAVVDRTTIEKAIAERPSLSDEQEAMVRSLTGSGAGVEVVVGRAGSGKTFALDAARQAWTDAGNHVIGAALAARAAAELQAGSGIPSSTVDALLTDLDRPGAFSPLPARSVIVVDEAAMVGTRKLGRLADHAERVGAKLVLVGDHRQLPEIEAGGAFAALTHLVPTSELTVNRRQADVWERQALAELRSGSVFDAVDDYRRQGRIHLAPSAEVARQQLADDWWAAYQTSGPAAAMYALRRYEVDDLNRRARRHMRADGLLGPDQLEAAGRPFAAGDEVICLHNDRQLGVTNGTRSRIESVYTAERAVTLTDGTVLPGEYLDAGWLDHGYATTIHKAQGATVDRAFLLGSDTLYREAGYVGLSRARQANQLYIVAPEPGPDAADPLVETIRRLGATRAQTLAHEQLPEGRDRQPRRSDVVELVADPPDWLIDTLGPPPVTPDRRDEWTGAAGRIAAYRDIYQITDTADPLGPPPEELHQRRAWELGRLAIDEHHRSLEHDQGLHR